MNHRLLIARTGEEAEKNLWHVCDAANKSVYVGTLKQCEEFVNNREQKKEVPMAKKEPKFQKIALPLDLSKGKESTKRTLYVSISDDIRVFADPRQIGQLAGYSEIRTLTLIEQEDSVYPGTFQQYHAFLLSEVEDFLWNNDLIYREKEPQPGKAVRLLHFRED